LEIAAETDPNSFWNNLKNMSDSCDSSSTQITNQKLHFENLHTKHNLGPKQEDVLKNLELPEHNIDDNNTLDDPITEDDIICAATKLKHKKSAHSDRIRNEMIKSSVNHLTKNNWNDTFNRKFEAKLCKVVPRLSTKKTNTANTKTSIARSGQNSQKTHFTKM
jgi:hypothetical protein